MDKSANQEDLSLIKAAIDHRHAPVDDQKKSLYEIQVELEDAEPDEEFKWVPFRDLFRAKPGLVQEYFSLKKVNLEDILNEESEAYRAARQKGNYRRSGINHRNNDFNSNKPIERDFLDVAKKTMAITNKYQLQTNFSVEARGTGKLNAKKKRMRKFEETFGTQDRQNSRSKSKGRNNNPRKSWQKFGQQRE